MPGVCEGDVSGAANYRSSLFLLQLILIPFVLLSHTTACTASRHGFILSSRAWIGRSRHRPQAIEIRRSLAKTNLSQRRCSVRWSISHFDTKQVNLRCDHSADLMFHLPLSLCSKSWRNPAATLLRVSRAIRILCTSSRVRETGQEQARICLLHCRSCRQPAGHRRSDIANTCIRLRHADSV